MDKSLIRQVIDTVMTPRNLNWAWQYLEDIDKQWVQFDCPDCLQLEFHY